MTITCYSYGCVIIDSNTRAETNAFVSVGPSELLDVWCSPSIYTMYAHVCIASVSVFRHVAWVTSVIGSHIFYRFTSVAMFVLSTTLPFGPLLYVTWYMCASSLLNNTSLGECKQPCADDALGTHWRSFDMYLVAGLA